MVMWEMQIKEGGRLLMATLSIAPYSKQGIAKRSRL